MGKAVAEAAGLGWQGKHTNIGQPRTRLMALPRHHLHDSRAGPRHCPDRPLRLCRACLDACPTDAFPAPYRLDARRCISYLTIENKGPIRKNSARRSATASMAATIAWPPARGTSSPGPLPRQNSPARDDLREPALADLLQLDDAAFRAFFSGSPIKRIGRDRFVRNVLIAAGNSGDATLAGIVRALLGDGSPLVRGAAIWALARLVSDAEYSQRAASSLNTEATTLSARMASGAANQGVCMSEKRIFIFGAGLFGKAFALANPGAPPRSSARRARKRNSRRCARRHRSAAVRRRADRRHRRRAEANNASGGLGRAGRVRRSRARCRPRRDHGADARAAMDRLSLHCRGLRQS